MKLQTTWPAQVAAVSLIHDRALAFDSSLADLFDDSEVDLNFKGRVLLITHIHKRWTRLA